MMAKVKSWFNCDLQHAVQVQALNGNVFSMDNNGNQICVRIFDGGEKAVISATVTARCILADGSTVNLNGSLTSVNSQSVAVVDIPQSVLLIPGTLKISVQLTASSVVATIAAIITTVYATKTDNVITPSSQVISDWNAEISAQLASALKFTSQSLTDSEKATARSNISAASASELQAEATARATADTTLQGNIDAEAATRAAADADLKSAFLSASTNIVDNKNTWEVGTIKAADGTETSGTTRIRTNSLFGLSNDIVAITAKAGYEFLVYEWTNEDVYVGCMKEGGIFDKTASNFLWLTFFPMEEGYRYKVVMRNASNPSATMIVAEGSNMLCVMRKIDDSFMQRQQAADSKAVGEAIKIMTDATVVTGWSRSGRYYNTSGEAIITPGSPSPAANTNVCCIYSECNPGDYFTIYLYNSLAPASYRPWCFIDSEGNLLTKALTSSGWYKGTELCAPENAAYLCVNAGSLADHILYKGRMIASRFEMLNQRVARESNAIAYLTKNDLFWAARKGINQHGNIISNNGTYTSEPYSISDTKDLFVTVKEMIVDDEQIPLSLLVAEYEDDTFVKRTFISYDSVPQTYVKLSSNTNNIRFMIGYPSTLEITATDKVLDYFYAFLQKGVSSSEISQRTGITHAIPPTIGHLNVVRRCRQFTDIKWTPAFDIPRRSQMSGDRVGTTSPVFEDKFLAGVEYTGIPYARATRHASNWGYEDMKVGWTVGFDTFVSAVMNPESVVAKDSVYNKSQHNACFYATVCSALCSYAFNLDAYYTAHELPNAPGIKNHNVGVVGTIDPEDIVMGDMLLDPELHGAIITDIIKDDYGVIQFIEISEATTIGNDNWNVEGSQYGGVCRRKCWSVNDFLIKWDGYDVYRYAYIADVPYTKSPYVDTGDEGNTLCVVNFPCIPYPGENFVYKTGHIVSTKILTPAYKEGYTNKLRVTKDGENWNANGTTDYYDVSGQYVEVGFTEVGEYTAYLCQIENGEEIIKTRSCHWKVISDN